LRRKTHQTIVRVTADFEKIDLNTNVAALMELGNALGEFKPGSKIDAASSSLAYLSGNGLKRGCVLSAKH